MNTASFVIEQTDVLLSRFKSVARALLHTILFIRLPGHVRPQEVCCPEFENIDYVMNPNLEFEEELEKVRGLLRKKKFIQLTLSIHLITKPSGWFSSEQTVETERWTIPIRSIPDFDMKEQAVRDRIQAILASCDSYSSRVPTLPSGSTFRFTIYDASEEKGWTFAELADLIKKGPPSLFS